MSSPNRSHVEKMAHQLSVEFFYEHLNDQTPNPLHSYYEQNFNSLHPHYQQIPQQYYPSQLQVNLNYNPQITSFNAGQGSTSYLSSS
jgi:hypothetical protein